MTIAAKYPGTCTACSRPIRIGDSIEWQRGARPHHTSCSTVTPAPSPSRSPGRSRSRGTWTGCSCGSVEEYERPGDCFTCRHDR